MWKMISVAAISVGLAASAATVNYSYDAAGRLVKIDYGPSGGSITYTYDAAGNLLSRTVVQAGQSAPQTREQKKDPKTRKDPRKQV